MVCLGIDTPTKQLVFVVYIGLWVSYGLLNENAKKAHITFNSSHAVFVQTIFKILIAAACFLKQDGEFFELLKQLYTNRKYFLLYAVPAGLYALYDILAYINLRTFEATTYFLLLQIKLVVTVVIHGCIFRKSISKTQVVAVLVITAGCMLKTYGDVSVAAGLSTVSSISETDTISDTNESVTTTEAVESFGNSPSIVNYLLLGIQIFSSVVAAVYNEHLLKKPDNVGVNTQNLFMYIDTFLLILLSSMLGINKDSTSSHVPITILFSINVWPMIVIMSSIGIVTSVFLKYMDSIRKSIAAAMELVFLPLFSFLFFAIPIHSYLVGAVILVGIGVYLYSLPTVVPTSTSVNNSVNTSAKTSTDLPLNNFAHSSSSNSSEASIDVDDFERNLLAAEAAMDESDRSV